MTTRPISWPEIDLVKNAVLQIENEMGSMNATPRTMSSSVARNSRITLTVAASIKIFPRIIYAKNRTPFNASGAARNVRARRVRKYVEGM
jgi:hypothetical protein